MRRVERETRATYASPPLHSNNEKKEPKMSIKSTRQFKNGVDGDALAELGLVRVTTMSMKLKAKSSQAA